MRLKLVLDEETAQRLVALAKRERRPVDWQAEVVLCKALARKIVEPAIAPTAEAVDSGK